MRSAFEWCFRDRRSGAIVIGQWPNLPLWLFIAASAAAWPLDPAGGPGSAFRVAAMACLLAWSLDELLRGVNPWRRGLGAAGIAYLVWRVAGG